MSRDEASCECINGFCANAIGEGSRACICFGLWNGDTCADDSVHNHPAGIIWRVIGTTIVAFTASFILRSLGKAVRDGKVTSPIVSLLAWSGISVVVRFLHRNGYAPWHVELRVLAFVSAVATKACMTTMLAFTRYIRPRRSLMRRIIWSINCASMMLILVILLGAEATHAYNVGRVGWVIDVLVFTPVLCAQTWHTRRRIRCSMVDDHEITGKCTSMLHSLSLITVVVFGIIIAHVALGIESWEMASVMGVWYIPVFAFLVLTPMLTFWVMILFWSQAKTMSILLQDHLVFLLSFGRRSVLPSMDARRAMPRSSTLAVGRQRGFSRAKTVTVPQLPQSADSDGRAVRVDAAPPMPPTAPTAAWSQQTIA